MNILQEKDGNYSMRRTLALFFSLVACADAVLSILKGASWQIVAVSIGVPVLAVLVLLFFTTWADITTTIKAIKDDN